MIMNVKEQKVINENVVAEIKYEENKMFCLIKNI